jgi:hypothetical protein
VTLQEHAKAIQDAILAARNEGFELDNGDGEAILNLDLNRVEDGVMGDWITIELPEPTFY